jgi:predicted nucleic acid-binding protein
VIHLFFDTCALARRYFSDTGSRNVQQLLALPDAALVTDLLVIAETAGVFRSALNDSHIREFNRREFDEAMSLLPSHWQAQYCVLPLDGRAVTDALSLISRYNVRGPDAIHLALASRYCRAVARKEPQDIVVVVTSDGDLAKVARAERIKVFNFWQCRCPNCDKEFPPKKDKVNVCPACGFMCHCGRDECKSNYRVSADRLLTL